jgi:pectate lyase
LCFDSAVYGAATIRTPGGATNKDLIPMINYVLLALALLLAPATAGAQVTAFPGAEGYGAATVGGRGGAVHRVTTLADSGPSTLRACVEASGPRTCVFVVSGTIALMSPMSIRGGGFLTIAGQTSPGGVQIRLADNATRGCSPLMGVNVRDVIIRHVRWRPGFNRNNPNFRRQCIDGLTFERVRNVVLDHNSIEWAADEGINFHQGAFDVTISWNLVAQSLAGHPYGSVTCSDAHRSGCGRITWKGNAFHGMARRSPSAKTAGGAFGPHDIINNVVSGPGAVGIELWDDHPLDGTGTWANIVGNYGQRGNQTSRRTAALVNEGNVTPAPNIWYAADNVASGLPLYSGNNNAIGPVSGPTRSSPVAPLSVVPWPGAETKARVLAEVGAWPRDEIDQRMITEMSGATSVSTNPVTAGPWPVLTGSAIDDDDADGMGDDWERATGLDPLNAADHAGDLDGDGYTNLEEYLEHRHLAVMGR